MATDRMGKGRSEQGIASLTAVLAVLVVVLGIVAAAGWMRPPPEPDIVTETVTETETETVEVPRDPTLQERAEAADPIPDDVFGFQIDPDKGYFVEHLGDGLYWATEGTYQVIFLTTGEGVIVVDAPPSMGNLTLAAIAEVTEETVTHVVYSHSHADHIAAAGMYPDDAAYIAHEATAEQLARDRPFDFGLFVGGGPVPAPTVTFADEMILTVGNQTLELHYMGPAHEPGNLFIYAPQQRVLMLVDVIFPGWAPFFELAVAEDVPAFVAAHDQALSFDFEVFVGGHLTKLGTREDVEAQRDYVLAVQANAAQALQTVDFFAIADATGFRNPWLLFGAYLDAVADRCAELTLEEWADRLAGADQVTESHCGVMVESLRID